MVDRAQLERLVGRETALPPSVTGTCVTVGTFDGVHRGHQDVLERLRARASATGLHSVLVTFDPHPLEVVRPGSAPPLLTLPHEKREVLAEVGLDYVAVLPFTSTLAAYSAEQFVAFVLLGRYRMRELLIGYDHGFGRGRAGDVDVLQRLGRKYGFAMDVVEPVSAGQERPVSSSLVRHAVAAADLETAADALGRPYSMSGRVVHGEGRGRALGYRTLNLDAERGRKLLPPEGVYAIRAHTPDGVHGGMLNLGPRPTFDEAEERVEAHLFDVSRDWYGAWVRLDFLQRLRDTRRFPDAEALTRQLAADETAARAALTRWSIAGNLYSSARYGPSAG